MAAGLVSDPDSQLPPPAGKPQEHRPNLSDFVPPEPQALAAKFPQLEIMELVGQGGMGVVYKARQRDLDRLVAVKILPPEVGQDSEFAERFVREARALAKLNHHNIVQVYDFGRNAEFFYLIMEFVDGVNIRHTIQTGGLEPDMALAIVPQVCEALQFAHDEGIVHRDIKPENVLINKRGLVKIADFGLAKMLGQAPADFTLTGTHQVMGTLHYMAPEQTQGSHAVDHRADIYSLGVLFYEMLTGELPIGRFQPPSKKAQLDGRLDEVVLRALEGEPAQRYQQASHIKTDVERITGSPPPPTDAAAMEGFATGSDLEQARDQVRAPAIGLLVAGILHCLVFGAVLVLLFLSLSARSAAHVPPEAVEEPKMDEPDLQTVAVERHLMWQRGA
jgi:serine/threonine protein kinase